MTATTTDILRERGWEGLHMPKDLAVALNTAVVLLELFLGRHLSTADESGHVRHICLVCTSGALSCLASAAL
jgi:hypothetical protein